MGARAVKTRLHFEAPKDLSVGTVRIVGEGQTIAEWVATPGNRIFQQVGLKPGVYSAEIGPAGVAPQSVVFEVREGQANNVALPTFSALSSSGTNISFFDSSTLQAVAEFPHALTLNIPSTSEAAIGALETTSGERPQGKPDPSLRLEPVVVSGETKRISVGLSEERRGRETFEIYRDTSRIQLVSGRVEIDIPSNPSHDSWADHRVKLSVAIEQSRIEYCLLPLYLGGTKITIAPPPFAPSDIELSILPIDPRRRALVRALDAGSSAEASAVRDDVLRKDNPASLLAEERGDPWAAILSGLLAIRFPDVFDPIEPAWADELFQRAGWAFDTHVIRASRTLSAVADADPEAEDRAVASAVADLSRAESSGPPYYRYTNQLFGEMAAGISEYPRLKVLGIDADTAKRFDRLHARWRRELPLQRGAGSTFTWLANDAAALKERNVLVPHRHPSGKLQARDISVVLEGQVSAGQIAISDRPRGAEQSATKAVHNSPDAVAASDEAEDDGLASIPAFARDPGPDDDPNKGRFGGKSDQGGFRLSASFEETKSPNWVAINLIVEADPSIKIGLGAFAWFVLHPTFSPAAIKVTFRGNRACLRIKAWGGFTVGVWIPNPGVELELDLAQIEDAPKIVKLL